MRISYIFFFAWLILFIFNSKKVQAQTAVAVADTLPLQVSKDSLKAPVRYIAKDSMIYDITHKKVLLYGSASISQEGRQLSAAQISFDQTSNLVKATSYTDTLTNKVQGKPIFTDNGKQFVSDEMTYNFKTQKGKISNLITKESDGYLKGTEVKKDADNNMFAKDAYYTTCNLEHPHFQIQVDKVKVIPDKVIVSGPAQLVIEDVPTPIILPFAIFPLQKGQRSGVVIPAYGYSPNLGYFFSRGGYYIGLGEYADVALVADLYTRGSWRTSLATRYKKRYQYSGNLNIDYGNTKAGDPITTQYKVQKDFRIMWSHQQDPKAHPYRTFSANVNFGSSTFLTAYEIYNADVLTNTLGSSIAYNYNIPYSPFSLSVRAAHSQNTNTRLMNLILPEATFTMARIQPFKHKKTVGQPKWYEKIGVIYNVNTKLQTNIIDSLFFTNQLFKKIDNGLKHNAAISTDLRFLKYITFTPSINYRGFLYTQSTQKQYIADTTYVFNQNNEITDTLPPYIKTDTLIGLKYANSFDASINFITKLFGVKRFSKGLLRGIRHELTPSVGMTFMPDFSKSQWGYYKKLPYINAKNKPDTLQYSIFETNIYGSPSAFPQAALTFAVGNNLQIKTFSAKDTSGEKKIRLLDRLNFSSAYNFIADSLKWSPVNVSGGTNIFNKLNLDFRAALDPYQVDSNNTRINKYQSQSTQNKSLLRFDNAALTIHTAFAPKTPATPNTTHKGTPQEQAEVIEYASDFLDFKIPWQIGIDYTMSFDKNRYKGRDTLIFTQTLNFNADITLTPKWKILVNSGYDFKNKAMARTTINVVRDLHCWEMNFFISPFGKFQNYNFLIRVKSSVLQDLKLTRRRYWSGF